MKNRPWPLDYSSLVDFNYLVFCAGLLAFDSDTAQTL